MMVAGMEGQGATDASAGWLQGSAVVTLRANGGLRLPPPVCRPLLAAPVPLVLTAHPHGCVLVFPEARWAAVAARVCAVPSFDRNAQALKRLLLGFACTVPLTGDGGFVLPPALRQFGELSGGVRVVGVGSHLECWSDDRWGAQQAVAQAALLAGVPQGFAELVL